MPDLLATHRALLEQWRGAMNLVGPGDATEHYRDAELGLARLVPRGRWADLGTGAGFPGIVFAARFPEVQLDLVDSRKKRCVFLEQVLAAAGIPRESVGVRCERVEDLEPASYDGVIARALAPPADVLDHAARLLVDGGLAVLFLGDTQPPDDPRFEVFHVERYRLDGRERRAVTLRRRAR